MNVSLSWRGERAAKYFQEHRQRSRDISGMSTRRGGENADHSLRGEREEKRGKAAGRHEMLICWPRPATLTPRSSFLCEELHQFELGLVKQGESEQE